MTTAPDCNGAIPVHSVAEEYNWLRQATCACGARQFQLCRQALLEVKGAYYDQLEVQCGACGAGRTFLFDIRSFFSQRSTLDNSA